MHPRKNTHRHEDSSLEKNNLITTQEGWFSQVSEESYLNSSEGLVHATEKSSECVYTQQVGTGHLTGLFYSKAHPQPMIRRGLSWPDISFCPQPSAAPIVLPYWDWVGISFLLLYWVGKKDFIWVLPEKVFGQPFERILWKNFIDNIIEYYLLWWDLNFSLLAFLCHSSWK